MQTTTITQTKKLVIAALCVALGCILPMAFHAVPNAGSVMLPMHIPVLLCGLVCGWQYGLACGILAPLVSSLATGMPPLAILPGMLCELAVYGLIAGLILRFVHTGRTLADIYFALIGAMLAGRMTYGILNSLIFRAGEYSAQVWLTAAFVTGLPGIVIQLVFLPAIVLALQKSGFVRVR